MNEIDVSQPCILLQWQLASLTQQNRSLSAGGGKCHGLAGQSAVSAAEGNLAPGRIIPQFGDMAEMGLSRISFLLLAILSGNSDHPPPLITTL